MSDGGMRAGRGGDETFTGKNVDAVSALRGKLLSLILGGISSRATFGKGQLCEFETDFELWRTRGSGCCGGFWLQRLPK
jgi:hypothetical protein